MTNCVLLDHCKISLILLQNEKTPLKLAMERSHSSVVSYIKHLQEHHTGTVGGIHEVCLVLMHNYSYDVYICTCVCVCVCVYACLCICTHTHPHRHTHMYVCVCVHACGLCV